MSKIIENTSDIVSEITTTAEKQMEATQDTVGNVAKISVSANAIGANVNNNVANAAEVVDRTGKIIEDTSNRRTFMKNCTGTA